MDDLNLIYIATQNFIYIYSLKKINKNLNSIKYKFDFKDLISNYQ